MELRARSFQIFPKQCLHYGVLTANKGQPRCTPLARPPRPHKMLKNHKFLKLFNKKRCWRLSFEVPRFSFCRVLKIYLFLVQNAIRPPWAHLGGRCVTRGLIWGADERLQGVSRGRLGREATKSLYGGDWLVQRPRGRFQGEIE